MPADDAHDRSGPSPASSPASSSTAWTVGSLVGIAAWIGTTVLVAARNPDPGDGTAVLRAFAAGGALFFGVIFTVGLLQLRRTQLQAPSVLYDRLALEPVPAAAVRRAARGTRTIGYVYLGFGLLTTLLVLAAIGLADDATSSLLLRVGFGLVVLWAVYAAYALTRAWSGAEQLMAPLGLRLAATPTPVAGLGGGRDLVGEVAYVGARHGREVRIRQQAKVAVTTVTGGDPRRKPPTTALQMATLTGESVRRWRDVAVAVEPDGTVAVTRRGNGAGGAFLHDLLLAEAIAGPATPR